MNRVLAWLFGTPTVVNLHISTDEGPTIWSYYGREGKGLLQFWRECPSNFRNCNRTKALRHELDEALRQHRNHSAAAEKLGRDIAWLRKAVKVTKISEHEE